MNEFLGKTLKRIEEVFDCWFESGSMPFAQLHYPFSVTAEEFNARFPADFIGEGLDQTRGWFYTLNVIATALMDETPYKNLIVNGLVLAADGKKMSKRLGNYTSPEKIFDEYGADAVRVYLVNSPLVRAEPFSFKDEGVKSVVKEILLPIYNVMRFLVQNVSRWEEATGNDFRLNNLPPLNYSVFDMWIISSFKSLVELIQKEMSLYRLYNVFPPILIFLDSLSNWYFNIWRNLKKKSEI